MTGVAGNRSYDLILVGAGLANGLMAVRLAETRPELSLLVLDAAASAGGNHTWSFHESDLPAAERQWLAPFVEHRWPGYDVQFPGFRRRIASPYCSVTSERFAALLADRLGSRLRLGAPVAEIAPTAVILETGERLGARAVVDGRGPVTSRHVALGYQKFVGLELRLSAPHGLERPILMDATVPQLDGYRFVYVLPFSSDRLMIEDTYYSDGADLDAATVAARVEAYARDKGWRVREVVRQETGVLPIALGGDIEAFWDEGGPGVPRAGLRAALFHPTTGYSLPDAVRLASRVAALGDLSAASLYAATRRHSTEHWRRGGFFRLLNRMLFRAGRPDQRFKVLRRFNGLSASLIGRFYAGRLSRADKLRLLVGKPPVPFFDALPLIFTDGMPRR